MRTRAFHLLSVCSLLMLAYAPAVAQTANYSVGPQDVLTVSVFDQPTLSGKFTVEADGTLTFPLLGNIKVGGLSVRDIESELKTQLADGYVKNPHVSVTVDEYRSQRVFVVGEVKSAGAYPMSREMTLIEALARAGSTTDRASSEAIIVHQASGSEAVGPELPTNIDPSRIVHVDLKQLQAGALSENPQLHDGDTVFVPRAENVFVFGHVRNPGSYVLSRNTTVLQALSLAGGITDRGTTNRVKVVRMVNGKKEEVKVKLDDLVRPDDTILVPERLF